MLIILKYFIGFNATKSETLETLKTVGRYTEEEAFCATDNREEEKESRQKEVGKAYYK